MFCRLGMNPFVLQVATLCFKLAEQRIRQRDAFLQRQVTANLKNATPTAPKSSKKSSKASRRNRNRSFATNPQSPVVSRDELDTYVTDQRAFLSDVFRLLKNCLNLISTLETSGDGTAPSTPDADTSPDLGNRSRSSSPGRGATFKPYDDLKARALMLLCQLYLSTETEDIIACAAAVLKPTTPSPEVSFSCVESRNQLIFNGIWFFGPKGWRRPLKHSWDSCRSPPGKLRPTLN